MMPDYLFRLFSKDSWITYFVKNSRRDDAIFKFMIEKNINWLK